MISSEILSDPRAIRTRKLVEDAFLEVVSEKGFDKLSVNDVTEKAGINRATFYAHFEDKFTLLSQLIRRTFNQELEDRGLKTRAYCLGALELLLTVVCEFVEGIRSHCKPPREHLDWLLETQVKALMTEVLAAWIPEGEPAAHAASWAMYGLAESWVGEKRGKSAPDFASENLPLIAKMLDL